MNEPPSKIAQWSLTILVLVMAFPLLMHAALGRYLRPVADDFCIDGKLHDGFFSAMEFWFTEWTGRYLLVIMQHVILAGPSLLLQIMPGWTLLLWIVASVFLFYQVAKMLAIRTPLFAAMLLSLALIFATTEIAPNLEQSLFWASSLPLHLMPIPLLTLYAGIALYALRKAVSPKKAWLLAILGAIPLYFSGGGAESHLAFHIALLVILLLGTIRYLDGQTRRIALIFIGVGLVTSALSALTILLLPGTAVRRDVESHDLNILQVTIRSFGYTVYTNAIQINPEHPRRIISLGFLFFAALIFARMRGKRLQISRKTTLTLLAASGIITFVLMWSTIFTGYYGLGKALPERGRFLTLFILMCAVLVWGFAAGSWIPTRWGKISVLALIVLTLLGPLRSGINTLNRTDDFRALAADWDARDSFIIAQREAGIRDVTVVPMGVSVRDVFRLGTVVDDPSYWINVCVAEAYQIDTIVDPQTSDLPEFEEAS